MFEVFWDFEMFEFWILYFAKSRQRVRFGFFGSRHLADHPVLPSTQKDAHRNGSMVQMDFQPNLWHERKVMAKN